MSNILLEIKNVEKDFGSFKALKGVSLNLQEGNIMSLLGVNGAGKTNVVNLRKSVYHCYFSDRLYLKKGTEMAKKIWQP